MWRQQILKCEVKNQKISKFVIDTKNCRIVSFVCEYSWIYFLGISTSNTFCRHLSVFWPTILRTLVHLMRTSLFILSLCMLLCLCPGVLIWLNMLIYAPVKGSLKTHKHLFIHCLLHLVFPKDHSQESWKVQKIKILSVTVTTP